MAPSSSASKVAKLAQKGKGRQVRFQGGTLFPMVIIGVLVLLIPLVIYARQSRPAAGEGPPTTNDHWHAAFGIYACDEGGPLWLPLISGALEEVDSQGQPLSADFIGTGVHSHSDGVMHWHPYSGRATGTNAKLKVYLRNYDISLSDSKLTLPDDQGGDVFEEGTTKCVVNGEEKDATLKLWVWDNYATVDTAEPSIYTTNFGDVRIREDGMVFALAFVPEDVDPVAPDWSDRLPELGAADGSGAPPTTLPATDSTTTGDSTVDSSDIPTDSSDIPSDSSTVDSSTDSTTAADATTTTASTSTTG